MRMWRVPALITSVVLLLLVTLFVPVQSTNGLSQILSLAHQERLAIGADLLATRGVPAGLSVLSFDPSKPDSCKSAWNSIKDMKLQTVLDNANTTNGSVGNFALHPAKQDLVTGSYGVTMATGSGITQFMIQASFGAELQGVVDWSKQVSAIVDSNLPSDAASSVTETQKQVQDVITSTGWSNLHMNAKGIVTTGAAGNTFTPSHLTAQIGSDVVEVQQDQPVTIPGAASSTPISSGQLNLGSYVNAKIQDIVSQNTVESLLHYSCNLVQSVEYGPYKKQIIEGSQFQARAVTMHLKNFADLVQTSVDSYPAFTKTAAHDDKLLQFIYDTATLNNARPNQTFEEFRNDTYKAADSITLPSNEDIARTKQALETTSSITLYVDRALNIVGSGGSTSIGLTKTELQQDITSLGSSVTLSDDQLTRLCAVVCSGITIGGSSFHTPQTIKAQSAPQSTEDFQKTIENNQQFKNLAQKFQDTLTKYVPPSLLNPAFDSNISAPCAGGDYMFQADGSVLCTDVNLQQSTPSTVTPVL